MLRKTVMDKRNFILPGLHELTKDQRKTLRLPKEGQHLIVGSPGTGKSVVALCRTIESKYHKKILFLTFNHVLSHSTKQLMGNLKIECDTAMSWFYGLQWRLMDGKPETYEKSKMPEIEPHKPDYQRVIERLKGLSTDFSDHLLIIDEGQDLPPDWYDCLVELGFKNFFVVADQNQQITEENSTRADLQAVLGLQSQDVIELKENFRNVAPIAEFANCFYTDKSSPKPSIPERPSKNIPTLFEYHNIAKISEMILAEYDRDPSKLIGFIVPTENKREWYVKKLANDSVQRSKHKPIISTYHSDQKADIAIDFSHGGIVVLNDKSVKGIEFDTVFIIIDDFKMIGNDIESLKKRFYVMSSRAKEELFLFKSAVRPSLLDEILPKPDECSLTTGEVILKRLSI